MSGGSLNYICWTLEDVAGQILSRSATATPLRQAFSDHLELVAKALHDIEWVDSGDYAQGDEDEAIRACLSQTAIQAAVVKGAKEQAALLHTAAELLEALGDYDPKVGSK